MSNRTYICIACRTSARREARYGVDFDSVRCPECQSEMWSLCWRWRIPKKTDDVGWRELAEKVSGDASEKIKFATALTKNIEALSAQVGEADRIGDSSKRTARVLQLQARILRFEQARSILQEEQQQAQQVMRGNRR